MAHPPSLLRTIPSLAEPLGLVFAVLGGAMGLCALEGLALTDWDGAIAVGGPGVIGLVVGAALVWWGRRKRGTIRHREALLVVGLSWIILGGFGSVPFLVGPGLSWIDAIFETVSGFTTTGATILPEITERLDPTVHLWRVLTHWLGGLGIIVLFVALFPALGVGGKHLYRTEAPGPAGSGFTPQIRKTASVLWGVYTALTLIEWGLLWAVGMPFFEAQVHALSTMGTGGFSTNNASIAGYESAAIEWVIMLFMLFAGTNFGLFAQAYRRGVGAFWRNIEWKAYMAIWLFSTVLIAWDIRALTDGALEAVRLSGFQIATVMTTTGFASADYETWPVLSKAWMTLLYFVGGSSGSTAGGMKIVRILIVVNVALTAVRRWGDRAALETPRMGGRLISRDLAKGTLAYVAAFCFTIGLLTVFIALIETTDLVTSFSAALACVSNVGPGWGDVGATDNFGWLHPVSKFLLTVGMLLGRLEFFPILVFLLPRFWTNR